ncbi:helix-turn-helix transcriptional regulator [Paraburkholderia caribensis]|nr:MULTISPECIES: helix-turn-helix transcriptional regulator [Paraburkholderia]MCO4878236.1 helix-turn-helix domain-containing protein [Paraburkholderia caribensis]PTB28659.1 XRE family transcriptional regulator [Paraburkholderia caribensis]QLB66042.1 transcriptional regulator [Paraburkholderia caribensis]
MSIRHGLARALRAARKMRRVSQESLTVSSRTYLSALERGLQAPTLEKLDEIAGGIGVHPLTLLIYAYTVDQTPNEKLEMKERVLAEMAELERYDAASF